MKCIKLIVMPTKKYFSVILTLSLIAASGFTYDAMADIHIYRGRYTNTSDILTTWDGKHMYSGRYTNTSAILYTWDGKHIYRGRYTNTYDIIYTFDGKHLYRGRYTNTSDILLTFGAPVPVVIMLLNTI